MKRSTASRAALALCLLSLGAVPALRASQDSASDMSSAEAKKPAVEAAQDFLALADQGEYGKSWDAACDLFQKGVSRERWVSAMKQIRKPLGEVESRKVKASMYTQKLPGVPDGEYVVVDFTTHFHGKKGTETVVTALDGDGQWKMISYEIR